MSKSANRKSRSNEGVILYQNNVGKTVQTSWRPQLPLPKEVVPPTGSFEPSMRSSEMNRRSSAANTSSNKKDSYQSSPQVCGGSNKKWSFGRLFRRKKEAETESSSEEDRKAGFVVSPKYRKKDKKKRNSKHISGGFDHIVVSPTRDNEFFLPFEPVPAGESQSQSQSQSQLQSQLMTHRGPPVDYDPQNRTTNSLDRRGKRDRSKFLGPNEIQRHPSSEEEMISLNSSTTFAKYRSDESLGSGAIANNGQSRRSRAARNERYYKRLSRDGEVSHGQAPQVMYAVQPAQRWKTQPVPLSIYNGPYNEIETVKVSREQYPPPAMQVPTMKNSTSLGHVALQHPVKYGMPQQAVTENKRSISFDSHIHLQNVKKPMPPPPPPRDPMRRVSVANHNDHRPISYAFDRNGTSQAPSNNGMRGRCVSDDRIWAGKPPMYHSASSINHPPSVASSQNRRFITRAERDAHPSKKSLPTGLDSRYVAEGTPRSRKPIHLFNEAENKPVPAKPPSPMLIRTTKSGIPDPAPSNPQLSAEYWRRGRAPQQQRPETIFNKPRSLSSSRAGEHKSVPMYSEVSKPKQKPATTDPVQNVVSGKLLINPSKGSCNNYVEISDKSKKSNSLPNFYQKSLTLPRGLKTDSMTPNKYDEYVAEKRARNILEQSTKLAPDPPQRMVTKPLALPPDLSVTRKKPTNLEDAINELEAIYKSLKLGDESLLDRAERRDIPTPTDFEKYAEAHSEEFLDDDDDEPAGEPDIVRDDFAYRNLKHANIVPKIAAGEKQPPFGIPVGPIAISPRSDYLHVTPDSNCQKVRTGPFKYPDIVCDDLAVRTLRKDPLGQVKSQFAYPPGSLKKKRATRTQSANIYTLIQRNAAKPSGGDIDEFLELTKRLERAGSMSDIHKEDDDIPSTLHLLRSLREQELGSPKSIPFRHPSQGGAICSLPEVLSKETKPSAPLPVPNSDTEKSKMEEALNKIAKEARESSEKLTRDLMELRRGGLITTSRPSVNKPCIERDLEQIEAVSEAAKRCRHMLLDTIPAKDAEDMDSKQSPPRRLVSEDKLIKAIDQVSNAANKVCEKILNEIVSVEPPVVVQNSVEVRSPQEQKLVMPSLMQKLDPSSARIGEIAERCMRQISQLNDSPDYDNLHQVQTTACYESKNDNADLLIVPGSGYVTAAENEEEIDKIMKECEKQARKEVSKSAVRVSNPVGQSDGDKTAAITATTTSGSSSSSDCLKSSSSSMGPHLSSSITSFNPYSSSDYIMSPSSEFHAPSTDPIKTFSTTSYDVQSSSVTPNITNSPFSYSTPSPPLNATVCSSGGEKGERSGSASQYNSSEELAMIFGIEKSSPATTTTADTTATATNPELCESVLVCKLDTIDEDREEVLPCQVSRLYLPSYASNISIIVTSDVGDDDVSGECPRAQSSGQQFDSLSSIDESSNPDSGNVSLSDFPVQSPINASLEVELAHNSRFEVAKTFVNEVKISEEASDIENLRKLYGQDEISTSFSNQNTELEDASDHAYDHDQIYGKDQNSPGQLLHEVLSQVSRINAGTNRKQLISQLENISECTKIVEDLSDRLGQQIVSLKDNEDTMFESKPKTRHRVRFSDECESDLEEDQNACLRSLQLLGHDLSSSEESIPPLGEIFNVPMTDSDNEDADSDRSSYIEDDDSNFFNFNEMDRSFAEECNSIKEALSNVVRSRQDYEHNASEDIDFQTESPAKSLDLEDSLTLSSEVVSVIEVVDSSLNRFQSDNVLSEIIEDQSIPQTPEAIDTLSTVKIEDLDQQDSLEDAHCVYNTSENVEDLFSKTKVSGFTGKPYLSPVNISLKIVNQVSKVSYVDCSEDDVEDSLSRPTHEIHNIDFFKNQSDFYQASEVIVVDSESDSSSEKTQSRAPIQFDNFDTSVGSNFTKDLTISSEFNCSPSLDTDESKFSKTFNHEELLESSDKVAKSSRNEEPLSSFQTHTNEVPCNDSLTDPSSSTHHRHLSLEGSFNQRQQHQEKSSHENSLLPHRPSSSPANLTASEAPSTSTATKSLSLLAQPRFDDRMTTLEHVLLVCTLGVVTGNDFITMLAIIIGVLTVIAMVLLT